MPFKRVKKTLKDASDEDEMKKQIQLFWKLRNDEASHRQQRHENWFISHGHASDGKKHTPLWHGIDDCLFACEEMIHQCING